MVSAWGGEPVQLESLDVGKCSIGNAGCASLMAALAISCSYLVELKLPRNGLGIMDGGHAAFTAELNTFVRDGACELHVIDLSYNSLTLVHVDSLLWAYGHAKPNPTLRYLDLSWNNLGNPGAMARPRTFLRGCVLNRLTLALPAAAPATTLALSRHHC